jgi:hypothetical protein
MDLYTQMNVRYTWNLTEIVNFLPDYENKNIDIEFSGHE